MKSFKLKKNRSIKYTWLGTYIVLFLLPIVILVSIFFVVDGTLKKEINKSNYFLLKQVQQYMDNLVNDIDKVAMNITFNERVQATGFLKGDISDADRYKVIEIYKELNNNIYNDAITEVYIYYKNIDLVISNKFVMESNQYFQLFSQSNGVSTKEWTNINNKIYSGTYVNLNGSENDITNSDKMLAYMITIPINSGYDGNANIVVVVDKSKFLGMAKDIEAITKGDIGILDENNKFILKSGKLGTDAKVKYENLQGDSGVLYENINGSKLAVSYFTSGFKKWKYISTMPMSQYWDKLEEYRKLIFAGIILCITLGIIVTTYLFKKNYEPMKELIKSLSNFNEVDNENNNEYHVISNIIGRSIEEKKKIETWISTQKETLTTRYIETLLKGRNIEKSLSNANMLDINFNWNNFLVISFNMEGLYEIMEKESVNTLEAYKLIQFIIQNMLGEQMGRVFTVDIDNYVVALLNLQHKPTDFNLYCTETLIKIKDVIRKNYNLELPIAISNFYGEVSEINKAYEETRELMEFVEVVGGDGILYYQDAKLRVDSQYYYPLEQEQMLINSLKLGDFEKTKKVMEHILNKNLSDGINNNLVKCLKFNLIGSLINATKDIIESNGEEYISYLSKIEELIKLKNLIKVKENSLLLLYEICEKLTLDKSSGAQIGEKVINFIKENYKDENLNITIIAETFNMNPAYISKLFKLQTSEGILDYISKLRIEESIKLIKSENCNLESIAKKVGYSNIKTFARAFSKIQGVTPGKYKDNMC